MITINNFFRESRAHSDIDRAALGREAPLEALRHLRHCPHYAATPLLSLPRLGAELDIAALHIKDEGQRLGLGSFKALGGAYAVVRIVVQAASAALGRTIGLSALQAPEVRQAAARVTVCCATDGNHGRSVAAGARLVGANAVIFLHEGVSAEREAAIAAFGARTVRVAGTYDHSVAEALRVAAGNGWTVVSDTSWPGYEEVPLQVMQGYTVMLHEALAALEQPPTHIFIQSGVGGVAAAIAGHLADLDGIAMPRLVVVEPSAAACLLAAAKSGDAGPIPHDGSTVMAMLECYEPSLVAWRILKTTAYAFMTVEDHEAIDAMRRLAHPLGGDPAIVAGESGGVGLAALIKVSKDAEARRLLGLDAQARVLLFNTEGATDPVIYRTLTGTDPRTLHDTAPA